MKKSQSITLTVVAAVAMATAKAQNPAPAPAVPPADTHDCNEILRDAGINHTPIPAQCISRGHNGYIGARVGGFGEIAQVRQRRPGG